MNNQRKIIIYGCGGASRVVADVILSNNPKENLVFVDDFAQENEKILGFDVVKSYPQQQHDCCLAIGDNIKRKNKFDEIDKTNLISVISKSASISNYCKIDVGCMVGYFCRIGSEVIISKNNMINASTIIAHEVIIGDHCFIGTHAAILGRANIGDLVFIGASATILPKLNICSNVIIGAGATVVKDITSPGTYVGTPARKIK